MTIAIALNDEDAGAVCGWWWWWWWWWSWWWWWWWSCVSLRPINACFVCIGAKNQNLRYQKHDIISLETQHAKDTRTYYAVELCRHRTDIAVSSLNTAAHIIRCNPHHANAYEISNIRNIITIIIIIFIVIIIIIMIVIISSYSSLRVLSEAQNHYEFIAFFEHTIQNPYDFIRFWAWRLESLWHYGAFRLQIDGPTTLRLKKLSLIIILKTHKPNMVMMMIWW